MLLPSLALSAALVVVPAAAEADVPPLVLHDSEGTALVEVDASAHPSFATAAASACAGPADAVRLVVTGPERVVISTAQPASPGEAPVAAPDLPLADAAAGDAFDLALECLAMEQGLPVATGETFAVGLERVDGSVYAVSPAPAVVDPGEPDPEPEPEPEPEPAPAPDGEPGDEEPSAPAPQVPSGDDDAPAQDDDGDLAATGGDGLALWAWGGATALIAAGAGALALRRRAAS